MQRMNTVFWSADTGLAPFFHDEYCMDSKNTAQPIPGNFWLISPPAKQAFPVYSFSKIKVKNIVAVAAIATDRTAKEVIKLT
jgi:hypothetical protein